MTAALSAAGESVYVLPGEVSARARDRTWHD